MVSHYVCYFFFILIMRVILHDWERWRWWTRFVVNWALYVFSFIFLYVLGMSSSTLAFLIFLFICISRTPRKSYSNFTFLLAPFLLFFTCTSALSSFRRRRVQGLILSISFLHLHVQHYRGKRWNSFESANREDWILFLPRPIIRTLQSSHRNVFVRRAARDYLRNHAFSLDDFWSRIWKKEREFLFHEKIK